MNNLHMKQFLSRLSIFVCVSLLILFVFDIIVSSYLANSNTCAGEIEVWNDIYEGAVESDILIYGSSRAWVHVNPAILYDSLGCFAYNFGIDGHNFWMQYLRHREYLRYNQPPKLIIHSVDVFTLEKRGDLYNMNQFLPFMLWNWNMYQYTSSEKGFMIFDYCIPFVRYFSQKSVLENLDFSKNQTPYRTRGYKARNLEWNSDFDNARKKRKRYPVQIDSASVALYSQFIAECKQQNSTLVMVYSPEYIEGQNYILNRDEIMAVYTSIAQKHSIPFLDYSNDSLCFNKEYFYNASHLNALGSELFTKTLAHDIQALFLSKNCEKNIQTFE